MGSLSDQIVLITGATSGIGRALALEFARQGAHLVLFGRRADRLEEAAHEVEALGRRALAVPGDVNRDADLEAAVARATETFGRLDVVIANAGFGVAGDFERLSIDDYRRQFETNIFGVLRTVKAVLPALKASRGRLAIVGSVNGFVALPGSSPYGMSKFAVRSLAASLYHEFRSYGISVTHIAPGFVDSEIRRVDNRGQLREAAPDPVPAWIRVPTPKAARAIVHAIAARRREAVITGHGKVIVTFSRLFPGLFHSLLRAAKLRARPEP